VNLTDRNKGYIFAFIAVLATSNVFVFSKAALLSTRLEVFGFYWFLFGLVWNLIFANITGKIKLINKLKKRQLLVLGTLGFLEISGTTCFFLAISTVPNPAIVSFLTNINPIVVTILGFFILKERYNRTEVFGIFLVILGAFTISFNGGESLQEFFIDGSEFVLLSALFYGISAIVTKKHVKVIGPSILALNRNSFLFVFSFLMLMVNQRGGLVESNALINILIGSILGPFLTVVSGYQAFKYLEVSRVSILGSTKGLFVLIGSYIYLGQFPLIYQIVGGLVSILGVVFISLGKLKLKKK